MQADYLIKLLCKVLALPRNWYFKPAKPDEAPLKQALEQVIKQFLTYGSWRITHQLRRDNAKCKTISRKRMRRVLGKIDLKVRHRSVKKQTTNSRHAYPRYPYLVKELKIIRPD